MERGIQNPVNIARTGTRLLALQNRLTARLLTSLLARSDVTKVAGMNELRLGVNSP